VKQDLKGGGNVSDQMVPMVQSTDRLGPKRMLGYAGPVVELSTEGQLI
jgi:hypothetical protein